MTAADSDELVYTWHDMWRECVELRTRPGYTVHVDEEAKTLIVTLFRAGDVRELTLRQRPGRPWAFETARYAVGTTYDGGNLTSIQAMLDLFDWLRGGA